MIYFFILVVSYDLIPFSNRICSKNFHDTWLMNILEYFTKIHSIEALCSHLNTKIYIGPDNKVLILHRDYRTAEQNSIVFDQNGTYLYSWMSYFYIFDEFLRVDSKIVDSAHRILEKKESMQREENEKNQLWSRINKMENDLQKIMEMIRLNERAPNAI